MMKKITFLLTLAVSVLMSAAAFAASPQFSTRTYALKDFTDIEVSSSVKVVYTQGDAYSVKLTGRTDWLDKMEVKAAGGKLTVRMRKNGKLQNTKKRDRPDDEHNFILTLTAPCINRIALCGISLFEARQIHSDDLRIGLDGVSTLQVGSIECADFRMDISGCSKTDVASLTCKDFTAEVSGASHVKVQRVAASRAKTNVRGASKISLPSFATTGDAIFGTSGASGLNLAAKGCKHLDIGFSGASKGQLSFKGGILRAVCKGASKLTASLDAASVYASCDGASKISLSGTADKVEVDRGGVGTNIDTSRLNQF